MFLISFLIFPYTCNFTKLQITTKTFIFLYVTLFLKKDWEINVKVPVSH